MTNWSDLEKQAGASERQYKDHAPKGTYKVKFAEAEIVDRETWKSPRVTFRWMDDTTYQYPRSAAHWLSMSNPAWRAVHNRNILMQMGVEKRKAEELIDAAEKDQDRAKLVKAYSALYARMAERNPEVEIVVQGQYRDGKPVCSERGTQYTESDFASSSVRMMDPEPNGSPNLMAGVDFDLKRNEEEILDIDSLPF